MGRRPEGTGQMAGEIQGTDQKATGATSRRLAEFRRVERPRRHLSAPRDVLSALV